MARCEQGYLCDRCGLEVGEMTDSALYLRYILGEVAPERLHRQRERHLRCDPELAQYIVDPAFQPVRCEGAFAKEAMDRDYVAAEEERVTRGWRRLQEVAGLGIPIVEYPLPEVIARWGRERET